MAMSYTIYAFGNVAELQSMFNGIAMVMNGGEYGTLLHTLSIFCLMMFTTAGIVKAMNLEPVTHLLGVGFFYLTLFVPKADVVIVDTMGQGPVTVSNVPLGIAMMNAMTSQMGYWLTTRYETSFGVVDDLQYQKNGMLFGANIYKNLNAAKPLDPTIYSNMTNFFKSCVMPELGSDPTKQNDINVSDDVWNLVSGTWTNPAYIVTVYSGTTAATLNCNDAWTAIDTQFKNYMPTYEAQLGSMINAGKVTTLTPDALLESQIASTVNSIITTSKTAQDLLMQAMSVNLLKDQFMSNQSAWAVAQAAAQYNSGAVTSGYLVNESLPLMRNVIETILIAMTPIVILMCVVAGMPRGLVVLKHYFAGCIWVQLWAPLYAVVNNLAWQHTGKGVAAAMAGYQGITLQNQASALSSIISSEAMVANLLYLIPILSLMVAYAGVQSASAVAGGLMQSAISSGNTVGSQVATGNSSIGNSQWGNTSVSNYQNGNFSKGSYSTSAVSQGQVNNAPTFSGQSATVNTDGLSIMTGASGSVIGAGYSAGANSPFSAMKNMSFGAENSTGTSRNVSGGGGETSTLKTGTSASLSAKEGNEIRNSLSSSLGKMFGLSSSTGDTQDATKTVGNNKNTDVSQRSDASYGRSERDTFSTDQKISGNLGLAGGSKPTQPAAAPEGAAPSTNASGGAIGKFLDAMGIKASGGIGIGAGHSHQLSDELASKVVQAAENKNGTFTQAQQSAAKRVLDDFKKSDDFKAMSEGSKTATNGLTASKDQNTSADKSSSRKVDDTTSATNSSSTTNSGSLGINSGGMLSQRALEAALDKKPGEFISMGEAKGLLQQMRADPSGFGQATMNKVQRTLSSEMGNPGPGATNKQQMTPEQQSLKAASTEAVTAANAGNIQAVNGAYPNYQGQVAQNRAATGTPAPTGSVGDGGLAGKVEAGLSSGQQSLMETRQQGQVAGSVQAITGDIASQQHKTGHGTAGNLYSGTPVYTPQQITAAAQMAIAEGNSVPVGAGAKPTPEQKQAQSLAMRLENYGNDNFPAVEKENTQKQLLQKMQQYVQEGKLYQK